MKTAPTKITSEKMKKKTFVIIKQQTILKFKVNFTIQFVLNKDVLNFSHDTRYQSIRHY